MKAVAKKINCIALVILLSIAQLLGIQAFDQWRFDAGSLVQNQAETPSGFSLNEQNDNFHQDLFVLPEIEEEEEEHRHSNFRKLLDDLIQSFHVAQQALATQQYSPGLVLAKPVHFLHGDVQAWISIFCI